MNKSRRYDPKSVEDLLKTGLLNQWYLVARDNEVGTTPVALKRLNREIVLWRDAEGKVNCLEDICPHRGVKLSIGHVCDGYLTCAYHGLQYDGEGTLKATPPTPDSPLLGKKLANAYPCREAHGAIWVYFSDGLRDEAPPEPEFPDEFNVGEWSGFVDIREFECNYQFVRDNQLDPVHGSFLHAGTHALSWGRKDADMGYEKTERGFVVWRKNQQGVNLDRTEVVRCNGTGYWAVTDLPYPRSEGGAFGTVRLFRYPTPIDCENTLVWNYRLQKLSGWKLDLWRFLYKNRVHLRGAEVLEQDRVALSGVSTEVFERENLLQCDIGVARIRRLYREEAERQFKAFSAPAAAAE